ncbi:unnamed protein product, partial [Nesidiocoris tenuis]
MRLVYICYQNHLLCTVIGVQTSQRHFFRKCSYAVWTFGSFGVFTPILAKR